MATPVSTASEYCTVLVRSKLLPAEEVQSLYKKWKQDRPGDDSRVDSFRRFLVVQRALTDYQAALIQRGHSEGYFLGSYKILDQIGKGQMGGVYKAVHNFGQIVALKILPASKAKNAHTLGRFQREARLLIQLDHPNVVRAFQVGESAGKHYIAMEYLEGETLDEVLGRRTRIPLPEAARLIRQILDGLQHLHDRRMVHRDVKPSNMMLTPGYDRNKLDATWDATVKILDIGLGRELFDENLPSGEVDTQLTEEGSVLGTPDYLAPEQAKNARTADIRADIYSVGCVFYHCLTGRPPFPETNIMAQMLKHATEKPAPLSQLLHSVPRGLQEIMDRFLAKSPVDRFQTPAQASAAIKHYITGGAAVAPTRLVPAFQDWLDAEANAEGPKDFQQSPPKGAPQPGITVPKPKTATAPAIGLGSTPESKPTTSPTSRPASPIAVPTKPTSGPARPVVGQATKGSEIEVNVELVAESANPQPPVMVSPVPQIPQVRPIWPPDRRDWLMLAAGAAGVLGAVGLGYGLARVLRRKPDQEENKS